MHILESIFYSVFVGSAYQTGRDGSCDGCVNYNFESDYEGLFTDEGLCSGLSTWTKGTYSTEDVKRPYEYAETFIKPGINLSCVTSFPISMTGGGTIQVNVYIHNTDPKFNDYFEVLAKKITATGNITTMGFGVLSSTDTNFVNGWQTLTFTLFGSDTFEGHLHFLGKYNYNSTILVDSFCYKPANYEGDCWVEYASTAQPEITTEIETIQTEWETEAVTEIDSTTSFVTEPATDTDSTTSDIYPTTSVNTDTTVIELEPTLSTPASEGNKCPLDPFIHKLLPHEYDCTLFYYCVWGEKVLRNCAAGLHFNPTIQVCDWPWSAGCSTQ